MPGSTPTPQYIETTEALVAFCQPLMAAPFIAIDTEFLRERTYRPELCLVQIKYQDALACIDTLAIDDLSALHSLLLNTSVIKVLHAASQDMEIFYLLLHKVPTPLFDTQIAAPLLGYNEQIGYGNLVKESLGIELPKAHTRADWTRRPLSQQQIAYALDDVIYLEKLYLKMRDELESLGRLQWLTPAFAEWENPKKYAQPANERWLKVRNIQRYKGATLAIIQALAAWREIKARELNTPRNWLMKDDVLCSIAQQQPTTIDDIGHIRSLDRRTKERFAEELLNLVKLSQSNTPEPLPAFVKKQKLTAVNHARVQLLNAWVHQRAVALKINPNILASQKILEKFVTGEGRAALQGWREPLLGDELDTLFSGHSAIVNTQQGLELQEN